MRWQLNSEVVFVCIWTMSEGNCPSRDPVSPRAIVRAQSLDLDSPFSGFWAFHRSCVG